MKWQPWASLLVYGIKTIEGRNWDTKFRGKLWIAAASKEPDPEVIKHYEDYYASIGCSKKFPKEYPISAILGCVDVVDVMSREEYRTKVHNNNFLIITLY